ncbi:exocyst complex component EXO70B1 [Mangifera indica]|uniref:exocyst complex component EXO70B1 n=1 Tax=Mangifera indica TaxID=29780 RepID=UPI001CFC378C|nr:exocyst complex component EXO70B1 [Mangifera indica]XP_044481705.1 exocyst complex component EXO70B1 [Mangifera indica]XP_044481707.1 exocyst complex component EXO70B1 [Mangifera indica]XP_044481708.1 exocyst complex component EXO70B1 [Mangifera indica]XP_044481709.1 exocyst complex component EXO70B1 [Mangifera indica]XP_044481710.1 exocyst complex component EXO70B1 [Mangifera indica]
MATDNGEEKLLAVARHIARTLGHNDDTMADDILQIFSTFDGRFSREKLADDDPRPSAPLPLSLKSLDRRISQYLASDRLIWADSADSSAFLDSIDELIATLRHWSPMAADKSINSCLVRADDLLQQAMFRLEDEFRSLMERGAESFELSDSTGNLSFDDEDEDEAEEEDALDDQQIPVAQPLSDYDIIIDALPSVTINDLNEIAKRMVAARFGKECTHVYSSCRRDFLEESLSRLGLQKFSNEEVQKMPWQDVEEQIERWVKAANVALRILFPSERRLCDRVFFGFSTAADLSFMEVCRGSCIQLLNFADAIAIGSRSPERLFRVLDVFEALRDLMPDFESVFSDHYCLVLRDEALTIWKRLGEAIRGIFMELENLIRRDPAKAPVPGGGLHPITRYVMNYVRAACRSRQTLEQIFEKDSSSSLSVQMDWIMELLESNLEVKSKIYGDLALCSVFMMNNGKYIVQKVKDSELGSLLGDDWIRKHNAKVRQYLSHYQRSSWTKVLAVLKLDSNASAPNSAAPPVARSMKDKLKSFNSLFDDICKTQSTWIIFDDQLREELRSSVARILLPPYGNFIGKLQNVPDIGKHPEKLVKYGVGDIEARINQLFQGTGALSGGRK